MKETKTIITCDYCGNQCDIAYSVREKDACSGCLDIHEDAYRIAHNELSKLHDFFRENKQGILQMLQNTDTEKLKIMFGNNGLELRARLMEYINDSGGQ